MTAKYGCNGNSLYIQSITGGFVMARKLTQKQESFCYAYIESGNASEAYRRCYNAGNMKPETINRMAKDVMDNPKIAARIEELRAPIRERAGISLQKHLATLGRLRKEAEAAGNYSAAITAETQRGKASGLYVERKEIAGINGNDLSLKVEFVAAG